MELIVDHKRTKVIFDKKEKVYIKKFNPKLQYKLKFFLGFRRYPGHNFKYIAEKLTELNINVPKIKSYSRYTIITEDIQGVVLRDYLLKDKTILKDFLDTIVKILESGIYFGDFNTGNFIVKDGEIYAIDLEDYRKELFCFRGLDHALFRLRNTLNNPQWYNYVEGQLKPSKKKKKSSILAHIKI